MHYHFHSVLSGSVWKSCSGLGRQTLRYFDEGAESVVLVFKIVLLCVKWLVQYGVRRTVAGWKASYSLLFFSPVTTAAAAASRLLSAPLSFDWVSVFNNLNCLLFAIKLQTLGSMRNGFSMSWKFCFGRMGICNKAAALGATFTGMSDGNGAIAFVLTFSLAVNA